jgi:uncharacterized OB-fold protein
VSEVFVKDELVTDPSARAGDRTTVRASRCASCLRTEFPAIATCPACGAPSPAIALGPDAVLSGFTEVLHPPPGAQVEVPYTIAVAAFPENIAVMGLLDRHVPAGELELGQPVEVCVVPTGAGLTYGYRLT